MVSEFPISDSPVVGREKEAPADRELTGPFDAREAIDVKPYVDFGGMLVLPREGMQLRLEVEEESKRVVAITLEIAESTLQVQAFAAARSEGLWAEIRSQIAEQIGAQGGSVTDVEGRLGNYVEARLPQGASGNAGSTVLFVGVDGPRWFLRGVIAGKAVTDAEARDTVIEVFRGIVVNRGSAPMPPRDLIPLRIPAPPVEPRDLPSQVKKEK